MRVNCPSAYMIWPQGFGGGFGSGFGGRMGMGGLGQDDSPVPLDILNSLPVGTAPNDTLTTADLTSTLTLPDLSSYITSPALAPTSSGPSSTAQILTAAGIATAAAAKGITAASGPYAVPGTNLVYNPATGQIINSAGMLVGQASLPGVGFDIASFMPLILGAAVLFVLVSSMGGGRR